MEPLSFSVSDWRHVALFTRDQSRIEMHLGARRPVTVRWPGGERSFGGERGSGGERGLGAVEHGEGGFFLDRGDKRIEL